MNIFTWVRRRIVAAGYVVCLGLCISPVVQAAEQTLLLDIVNGVNTSLDERVQVTQGDQISLLCTADTEVQIHLHGYDIEKTIAPGSTVSLRFDAHATGRFPVTLHGSGAAQAEHDDHSHDHKHEHKESQNDEDETVLFYLEVYPG